MMLSQIGREKEVMEYKFKGVIEEEKAK